PAQLAGPFIQTCPYCSWTSLDAGIQFATSNHISDQLLKLRKPRSQEQNSDEAGVKAIVQGQDAPPILTLSHEAHFSNLTSFYKTLLNDAPTLNPYAVFAASPGASAYSSPSNLARIITMYSASPSKNPQKKVLPLREALTSAEGLALLPPPASLGSETEIIARMRETGYFDTASLEQQREAPINYEKRFHLGKDALWPVATLLRTRRTRRCSTCRHILSKPETKQGITKYRIKLLASEHILRFMLRPLNLPLISASGLLKPHSTILYVLVVRNPLFNPVKVTLATPSTTPGKVESRVTILCPDFTVGASGEGVGNEVWDDALRSSTSSSRQTSSALSASGHEGRHTSGVGFEDRVPEAGKVWERGRNWVSVVLEIVPGSLNPPSIPLSFETLSIRQDQSGTANAVPGAMREDSETIGEDDEEAVLKIPVLVRMEWDADAGAEGPEAGHKGEVAKEKRELAFWSVFCIGRIGA
ncbi:hypothetical protein LTR28_011915, partial [Elasticomyces elasticus]